MKYVSWITSEENYCEFFRSTRTHQEIFKCFFQENTPAFNYSKQKIRSEDLVI